MSKGTETTPSPPHWGLFALALVPSLVLAAYHWSWPVPANASDYAQYLSHALALVEGRAYTDIGYIYHPEAWGIGPPAYPPGLPLLLAPIVALGGVHSAWIRVLSVALLMLFGALTFRRLAKSIAPWQAAFAAGATTLAIEAGGGTLAPLSDVPFCVLVWALLSLADGKAAWSWARVGAITALGFAAMAFRVPGVVVVPAIGLYALLKFRVHRWRAFVPPLVWVGAGGMALALGVVQVPYADTLDWVTSHGLMARLHLLVPQYKYALLDALFYPFPSDGWNDAWHVAAAALVVVGAVVVVMRLHRSAVFAFTVVYVAMLLVSPGGGDRYAWPLLPLVGASLAAGAQTVAGFARVASPRPAQAMSALVLVGALTTGLRAEPPRSMVATEDARSLHAWLRQEHAREAMRLVFWNPRVVTLESGVPAMSVLPRTAPGQLVGMQEKRIDRLIWQRDDLSNCRQQTLNTLPQLFPERFALVYSNATFRVYRLLPGEAYRGDYGPIDWENAGGSCGKPG